MLPVKQESASSSDCSDAEPRTPWKRGAAMVAGLTAALGCVACVVALSVEQANKNISARDFFEGRELATVVGDQYMKLEQSALQPDDCEAVRDHVQASFKQISNSIKETNPSSVRQLESMQLTRAQQKSVLHVMGYMSDPRVKTFGRDIRAAARDALSEQGGGNRESLIRHLNEQLTAHLGDLRQLAQEMFPSKVAERTPSAENLHIVEVFDAWRGSREVLARSSTALGRRMSGDNKHSPVARIGELNSLAWVVMNQFEQMHDGFKAPEVRKLQSDDLSACFQTVMNTMDPSCLFDSLGSGSMDSMESDFEEMCNEVMETLGIADTTPTPSPSVQPAVYTTPPPVPGSWR